MNMPALPPHLVAQAADPAGALTAGVGGLTTHALLGQPDGFGSGAPDGGPAFRYYVTRPRDAVHDTLRRLPLERGESRALVRSNGIAAGAIAINVDNVVGTGLALVCAPDRKVLGWTEEQAAEYKATVQREFSLWSDSPECDLRGELNFYDMQRLVERSSLESGDCFTLLPDGQKTATMPYRLRLQTLEADRCGNPDGRPDDEVVAGGVRRMLATGAAEAYHIYDRHPGAAFVGARVQMHKGVWVDRVGPSGRRRILHHFRALRPEMPRGVPYLAPITGLLDQLGRYTEAEIAAAVESANLTLIIKSPASTGPAPIFGLTEAQAATGEIALMPGAVIGLAPGEESELVNPLRPNSNFEPFILSIIKQIGMATGIPFEVLIKFYSESYSASKAARLDAWLRFRYERIWLARSYCQPVYQTWLTEAVILGRVKAPGYFRDPLLRWAYSQAAWFGDSQGSINPKDEIEAYIAAIEARLMTRERAEWEFGGTDWNATFETKEAEQKRLIAANMLPVPKAGAAAPADGSAASGEAQARAEAHAGQFNVLAAHIAELAVRESPAPQVTVNLAPAQVTVQQGDTTINLPESNITLEAVIEQPDVTVQAPSVVVEGSTFNVPAPQLQLLPAPATRQLVRSNAAGDIEEIITEPLLQPPAAASH